ncbi:hypothetical protein [Hyphomicrobium sp.]|uniref:hypothetical protein n=1 Tax=Hyphomicrobium sp. TaxID=82 RepID=UPI002FDD42B9
MSVGPALDDDARPAFLFESETGEWRAVALDKDGTALPRFGGQRWKLIQSFELGVREPVPANIDPEPILRGISARGFYVWRTSRILPVGTAQ